MFARGVGNGAEAGTGIVGIAVGWHTTGTGGICCTIVGCDCAALVESYRVVWAGEGGICSELLYLLEKDVGFGLHFHPLCWFELAVEVEDIEGVKVFCVCPFPSVLTSFRRLLPPWFPLVRPAFDVGILTARLVCEHGRGLMTYY